MTAPLGLVRNTAFNYFWASKAVDDVGSWAATVILPLVAVSQLEATALQVGTIQALALLPDLLLGLQVGVWIRGRNAVRLSVISDVTRALILALIPVAYLFDRLTLGQLALTAFLVGSLSLVADITSQSMVPSLVASGDLIAANGRLQTTSATAQVGGPAVGGLAASLAGPAVAVLLDVLSYLGSATLLSRVRRTILIPGVDKTQGHLAAVREGVQFVVRTPAMMLLLLVSTTVTLCLAGFSALSVPFLYQSLQVEAAVAGVLLALGGLGSVTGALVVSKWGSQLGTGRGIALSLATLSVLGPVSVLASGEGARRYLFGVAAFGVGFGVTGFNILVRAYRQSACPPAMLSRVLATTRFSVVGAAPIGAMGGGLLGSVWGIRFAIVSLFLLNAVAVLVALTSRTFRSAKWDEVVHDAAPKATAE